MPGRSLDSYRGAKRNALRGGIYRDGTGRRQYEPSQWPGKVRGTQSTVTRSLYSRIMSTWHRLNRKGKEHAHARAIARQA